MLGIEKVSIKGFQSHVDSSFKLSPGLTVITGPSDAGKTAVIRALRWIAFNEPQGEAFLHTIRNADGSIKSAVDEASVAVEFTDGTVITKTRRKGKTTYTHSLYPEPWEKAEVPPEIKETLGLLKQSYGDSFETCLNFAFQLDPPFLLSETGSAGAKVLGKLAGTEVVDKSIGAVNKLTHRIRTDIAQAEKTIGQLDVELLEYLHVDQNYETLLQLENNFQAVDEHLRKQKILSDLLNSYTGLTERKQGYLDTLNRFALLDSLVQSFSALVGNYNKLQILDSLDTSFWTHIKVCEASKKTLKAVEIVDSLKARVSVLEVLEIRTITLKDLNVKYTATAKFVSIAEDEISKATTVLQKKEAVHLLSDKFTRLGCLNSLSASHSIAVNQCNVLQGRITTLEVTTALKGKINGLQALFEKLRALNNIQHAFSEKWEEVEVIGEKVGILRFQITIANGELQEAWEAAGGVCPLCEQPIEGSENRCTH